MATTTVPRGAGRATHAEKTNRHAQRSPLPSRAGQVEAAESTTEEFARLCALPLAQQAQPKVQARIRKLGNLQENCGPRPTEELPPPGPARQEAQIKAAQARAMLARQRADEAPKPARRPKKPAVVDAEPLNQAPAVVDIGRSAVKAQLLSDALAVHGWASTIEIEGDLAEITATRGNETIHQAWVAGVYHAESASYTIGDRTVKLRNASQAKQVGARPAEAATAEFARVGANKAFRRREVEPERAGRLPFDPALATDAEVITKLLGKPVSWHNRFTQVPETATIGLDAKHVQVVTAPDGERVVKFVCRGAGFRAFRLAALLTVGKAPRHRKGASLLPEGEEPSQAADAA